MKRKPRPTPPGKLPPAAPGWLSAAGAIWMAGIAAVWFWHHLFMVRNGQRVSIHFGFLWDQGLLFGTLAPVAAALGLAVLFRLSRRERPGSKRGAIQNSGSIVTLLVLFQTLVLLMWNLAALGIIRPGGMGPVSLRLLVLANGMILVRTGAVGLWLLAMALVAYALGGWLLRAFRVKPETIALRALLAAGLGLWLLSLALFLLGLLHLLRWWAPLLIGLIAVLAGFRDLRELWGKLWRWRWALRWKWTDPEWIAAVLLLAALAMNLVDILRPMPVGWDDLEKYQNRARLMAAHGELVPGGFMFPVEILTSVGYLFFDSAMPSQALSWGSGLLAVLLIFHFCKRHWSSRSGWVAAVIFYTMPMVNYLSSQDLKVDATVCFISLLAAVSLWEWIRDRDRTGWLLLTGLLAGIAWTMKPTAGFLWVGLALVVLANLRGWLLPRSKQMLALGAGALIVLLPIGPWFVYNMSTRHWQWPTTMQESAWSEHPAQILATDAEWRRLGLEPRLVVATIWQEEVERYTGHLTGAWKYVRLPWDATMNTFINSRYVIIGFLYLAVVPVFLILLRWWPPDRVTRAALIFAAGYWLAWSALGRGIPWYALPGFVFLALFVARFLEHPGIPAWFRRLAMVLWLLSILAHLTLQGSRFGHPSIVRYAGGLISKAAFEEEIFPGYRRIADAVNRSASEPERPKRVWRIGSSIPYFIQDNDRIMVNDSYLDLFANLDREQDDRTTCRRFRSLGVRFFILDLNLWSATPDPEGTLARKAERFRIFATRNLQTRIYEPAGNIVLLELTP
jgi:hypothetical protein